MIAEQFKVIIDEDVVKCDREIKSGNKESRGVLYRTLVSKYGKIIDGFKDDLRDLFYDKEGTYVTQNLETIKQKLVLFKAMGYQNRYSQNESEHSLVINNTNKIEVNMNITFSEARAQVENMTSLQEDDIQEILSKLDELEKIVNSTERKTKKWEEAKGIIKWIADKGVDVALTFLPLLMKIGQP